MAESPKRRRKFGRGSDDTPSGACEACENGRHLECHSIRVEEDVWPLLDPLLDDSDTRDYVPSSFWTCPCLEHFDNIREDYGKHRGVMA